MRVATAGCCEGGAEDTVMDHSDFSGDEEGDEEGRGAILIDGLSMWQGAGVSVCVCGKGGQV